MLDLQTIIGQLYREVIKVSHTIYEMLTDGEQDCLGWHQQLVFHPARSNLCCCAAMEMSFALSQLADIVLHETLDAGAILSRA